MLCSLLAREGIGWERLCDLGGVLPGAYPSFSLGLVSLECLLYCELPDDWDLDFTESLSFLAVEIRPVLLSSRLSESLSSDLTSGCRPEDSAGLFLLLSP